MGDRWIHRAEKFVLNEFHGKTLLNILHLGNHMLGGATNIKVFVDVAWQDSLGPPQCLPLF